ncbi:methylated-DNA--[protein]-cysteine S-methyltransferase [bacterium]|nr:methylated-DNA--[protein]-cysteine S-methyltransferase [bacterium]
MPQYWRTTLLSPIGQLHLLANQNSLLMLAFEQNLEPLLARILQPGCQTIDGLNNVLRAADVQLDEYFAGERKHFTLPISMRGTDFQNAVWNSLLKIPYGTTWSYSDQAHELKRPNAIRAVGTANGLNPLCIVVPCHRVVAKSGDLSGYAGGKTAKVWLLKMEKSQSFERISKINSLLNGPKL